MAVRNPISGDRKLAVKVIMEDEPITVRLVLLKAVTLQTTGKVTGNLYLFPGAGSENDVDVRDADFLLSRVSKSCCSGNTNSPYFEIVR
jgi:hypothetical protein